jgi:uncharacterized coiled-coil DUF342 family protein
VAELGSTEWSLERKLATAERRIRTLDTQAAAHRQQINELERERALAQTELANWHRRASDAYKRVDELRAERDQLIEQVTSGRAGERELQDEIVALRRRYRAQATALVDLRAAVEDEGPRPDIHRKVVRETERVWPTLMRAVRKLLDG